MHVHNNTKRRMKQKKILKAKQVCKRYESAAAPPSPAAESYQSSCNSNSIDNSTQFWDDMATARHRQRQYEDSHPAYEIHHPSLPASFIVVDPGHPFTDHKLITAHQFIEIEAQRRKALERECRYTERMYRNRCEALEAKVQRCKVLLAEQRYKCEEEKQSIRTFWRDRILEGNTRGAEIVRRALGKGYFNLPKKC